MQYYIDWNTLQIIATYVTLFGLFLSIGLTILSYRLSSQIFRFERKTLLSTKFTESTMGAFFNIKNKGDKPVKKIEVTFFMELINPKKEEVKLDSWITDTDLNPDEDFSIPLSGKILEGLHAEGFISIRSIAIPPEYSGTVKEEALDTYILKKRVHLAVKAVGKYYSDIPKSEPFVIQKKLQLVYDFKPFTQPPNEFEENFTVRTWTEIGNWKPQEEERNCSKPPSRRYLGRFYLR